MRTTRSMSLMRHRGFTLIESIVCVSILAILMALLLPAVQSARESASRTQCANNLRQIGLALNNYEAGYGSFPHQNIGLTGPAHGALTGFGSFSAHVALLPYLDQGALFSAVNFSRPGAFEVTMEGAADLSPANATVARTALSVLLCPSDPASPTGEWAGTNYRTNLGTAGTTQGPNLPPIEAEDGAFVPLQTLRASDFTDGLSQTAAFGEKARGSSTTKFVPFTGYWFSRVLYTNQDEMIAACRLIRGTPPIFQGDTGMCWFLPYNRWTYYKHITGPNSAVPDCVGGWNNEDPAIYNGVFAARSHHPGGVYCAFADGHVRFVPNSISIATWRALGTRNGNELAAGEY